MDHDDLGAPALLPPLHHLQALHQTLILLVHRPRRLHLHHLHLLVDQATKPATKRVPLRALKALAVLGNQSIRCGTLGP